jgi:hypothetical protein
MKAAVWEHFHFEQDVEYPMLSRELLYGTLSNAVHNKVFSHMPVSNMADDSYKKFFRVLGKMYAYTIVEYDEMDAFTFEQEQKGKEATDDEEQEGKEATDDEEQEGKEASGDGDEKED